MPYNRYRLNYPFEGNKIYQSKSLNRAVKKCYRDFKKLHGSNIGTFTVENMDTNEVYTYKTKYRNNKTEIFMKGGSKQELYNKVIKLEKTIEELKQRINELEKK